MTLQDLVRRKTPKFIVARLVSSVPLRLTTTYHNGGASTTATKNNFRYRSYYYDADLKLYYLQSRYYDSNTGRFVSPDDVGYIGANGDLTSYNLYAYCSNNPIMNKDPSGNSAVGIILGVIAVVATVHDIYHLVKGKVKVDNEYTNEKNVQVQNSSKLLTPWMILGYSFYLNHFKESTKDVIKGTTVAVSYEWWLHNLAAWLNIGGERSKHVDVGATIFDDFNNRDNSDVSVKVLSATMAITYALILPTLGLIDWLVYGES